MNKHLQKKAGIFLAIVSMLPFASSFATSISISVSDSITSSITSSVNSISNSSKGVVNAAKLEGDYKITDIAADDRVDRMKIALRAEGDDRSKDVFLHMPVGDYQRSTIGVGQVVNVVPETYGFALFQEYVKQPFAIVVAENFATNLKPKVVS